MFNVENPSADERDFRELLNPESMKVHKNCYVEKFLSEKQPGDYLQFQRTGYFILDPDTTADHLVFNKTVGLKDTWAKKIKGVKYGLYWIYIIIVRSQAATSQIRRTARKQHQRDSLCRGSH